MLVLPYINVNPPQVYTYSPSWTPLLLPPCTIPLGHPSAPAPSILYPASNLDWRFISYMILYMFQCHSPKSSHPRPLPKSPKDCSIHLCLFCCLAYRVIVTIFLNSIYMHLYTILVYKLECKSRKSRNTWSNWQIWPWKTEWSRAKTNGVLPRKCTGHNKHPLPTTQEKTLYMDITRWSTPKSDWLYSLQPKMETLYTVNKNKTRSWLWLLRSWTPYCQIQT